MSTTIIFWLLAALNRWALSITAATYVLDAVPVVEVELALTGMLDAEAKSEDLDAEAEALAMEAE